MTGTYSTDRRWSDRFIPAIQRIVGPYLLCESPFEIDAKQAADLITLKARDLTIACRVRRPGYIEKYGWQFTVRCKRDSGAETELSKIVNGWGDWMFYAFATSDSPSDGFARWFLIDLASWRAQLIRRNGNLKMGDKPNNDGTYFKWFDVRSFEPEPPLLIDASEPIPAFKETEKVPGGHRPAPAAIEVAAADITW